MLIIEIKAKDPDLARYIALAIEHLKQDPIVNETLGRLPEEAKPGLFEVMLNVLTECFDSGLLPEHAAKRISKDMELANSDFAIFDGYAKTVESIVHKDPTFRRLIAMSDEIGARFAALGLAHAAIAGFRKGTPAEAMAEEYLTVVRDTVDQREQQMLMNMDIKGTH